MSHAPGEAYGVARIDPRLADAHNWFRANPGGDGLQLMDPIHYTPLDPNVPPRFIEEVPELGQGLDFLRRNAHNINLRCLFMRHTNAGDLGPSPESNPHLRAPAIEEEIARADYFGYEAFGNSLINDQAGRIDTDMYLTVMAQKGIWGLDAYLRMAAASTTNGKDHSFHHRLYRAIALARGTECIPIDVRRDGTHLERQLNAITEMRQDNPSDTATQWVETVSMVNAREWVMLATLGQRLMQQLGPTVRSPIKVTTLEGELHIDFVRKAIGLGIAATMDTLGPHSSLDSSHSLAQSVMKCVASRGDGL